MLRQMKAPIIVLEGLDASGKSTQTELLLDALKQKNISVGWMRFPQYEKTSAGARIAAYLRGEMGDMNALPPEIIASLYAADRLASLVEVERLRDEHDVVIFDRGVSSNLIYTPARADREKEATRLSAYVEQLEYDVFGFPRESLVIYLDASEEARAQIHAAKNRLADLHESDNQYLRKVRRVALERCDQDFRWVKVVVDKGGQLRRREDIHEEITNLVLEKMQRAK